MTGIDAGRSYPANVAILSVKFQKESWYNTFWAKFAGFADISQTESGVKMIGNPTGKVVTVYNEFAKEGRDHMLVPFLKELTEDGVIGDTKLAGTGETSEIDYLRIYINQVRKAVNEKSGAMAQQRIKLYDKIINESPRLMRWASRYENRCGIQAIYEGASENITKVVTEDGVGLKKRYHPNFYYVSAANTLTAVGTEKSTKTASQLDTAEGVVDGGSNYIITATIIDKIVIKAQELKIRPLVNESGHSYYLIILSPEQMRQAKNDSKIYGANREATSTKWLDSPELQGFNEKLYYSGAVMVSDIIAVRGWDVTTQGFKGSGSWDEAFVYTAGSGNHCLMLLGADSMAKGNAVGWNFTTESYDHDNVKELGINAIFGYNRMEYATVDTESTVFAFSTTGTPATPTANAVINQSSMIVMTNV